MSLSTTEKVYTAPELPRRFFDWYDFPLDVCDANFEQPRHYNDALKLDQALWILQHSPTIQAAFEIYEDLAAIEVTAKDLNSLGTYNFVSCAISVHQDYGLYDWVAVLPHEYRHAIHHLEGVLPVASKCSQKLNQRLYEADARAFQVTVAWELKELGFPYAWKACESGRWRNRLCAEFENSVKNNPETLQNGIAQHAVLLSFLKDQEAMQWYDRYSRYRKSKTGIRQKSAFNVASLYSNIFNGMPYDNDNFGREIREHYLSREKAPEVAQAIMSVL